jgi:hypothetical protein
MMKRVTFVYDYATITHTLDTDTEDEDAVAAEAMENLVAEFGTSLKGPNDYEVEELP